MSEMEPEFGPETDHETEPREENGPPPRRLVPNVKWFVVWLILIGGVFFLHFAAAEIEDRVPGIDQAVRNIITFAAMLGIPFTVVVWFSFFSDHGTRLIRWGVFGGYLALEAIVIFVMATLVELDGNMMPVGWKRSQQLAIPETAGQSVDLKTETADDFPQFLGPNRDGKLPNTWFAYDWEKEKPVMLWKQPIGEGHSGFSTRNGFAVTMEQRGELEVTSCYRIETGELMWTYSVEARHETPLGRVGPRSTPTIFDGYVYSLGALGHLACLDGRNGKPIWTRDLLKEFNTDRDKENVAVRWGRSASPLVFDDKVVVPAGGPNDGEIRSLVCYQRKTGEEIWRAGSTQISYASPTLMTYVDKNIGFTRCIVSVNESNVTAHEISTGKIIWETDWPGNSSSTASTSQPVMLPGSQVLLTKGYGSGAKMIQYQGGVLQEIWKNSTVLKTKFTNAVQHNAYAFALSDGRLECVDLRNGTRVWKSRKSYGHGQILLCGSELLVLSEKGYVALVRAWGGTEEQKVGRKHVQFTSFQAIEGTSWNTIAVHGNKLLVRNSREAACYEMPIRYQAEN